MPYVPLPTVQYPTLETILRTTDYSISSIEMSLAIGSIAPARRSNWWLLALAAPLASAVTRETIRRSYVPSTKATLGALVAPTLAALVGAGALSLTRPSRLRTRCRS